MSTGSDRYTELQGLIELLCDGRIEHGQLDRLQQLVVEHSDALDYYRTYMQLHGLLRSTAGTVEASRAGDPSAGTVAPGSQPVSPGAVLHGLPASILQLSTAWLTSPKTLGLTVLGGLLSYFVVLAVSIAISRSALEERDKLPGPRPGPSPVCLIGSDAARWQERSRRVAVGAELPPNISHLVTGIVEIEFAQGALVSVEGPAEFVPQSGNCIRLTRGKLVATVPRQARGFRVETPVAQLVDRGTEFGVEVDQQGRTDLHVLRGRVEVTPSSDTQAPARPARNVITGEAVRVESAGQSAVRIPIDQQRFSFARSAAPTAASLADASRAGAAEYPPIWLGNLFDDLPGTPLVDALGSDTYQASPMENGLGIERVIQAAGRPTKPNQPDWVADRVSPDGLLEIAPGVQCNLKSLGWSGMVHGNVANDASSKFATYQSGGLRTRGEPIPSSAPRIEEGIGMHADSLLTFDLDQIRAAGGLEGRPLEFVCDRVGVNDDDYAGIRHEASLHVAVLVSDSAGIRTCVVNGVVVDMALRDGVWLIDSKLGEPLKADGRFVRFRVPIGARGKYLTLVASSVDGNNNMDHAAWSGARLEIIEEKSAVPRK